MARYIVEGHDGKGYIVENDDEPDRKDIVEAERKRLLAEVAKNHGGYLANLGAGFDNVWQGIKQIAGKGDSDEEINKRREEKAALAEGTIGGGLTQLAGEMLASAPITGGITGVAGKVLGKLLPKAIELAMKGGKVANVGTVADSIAQGAMGGALAETTSDEDKGINALAGGTVGAVLPGAIAGVNAVRKALSKSNAPMRAAKIFEGRLGKEGVQEVEDALHSPSNTPVLPLSTAAKANNTKLAAMERGARTRQDWGFEHDRDLSRAAWNELTGATASADELASRVTSREDFMRASKEALSRHADPAHLQDAKDIISSAAQSIRDSAVGRQYPEVAHEIGMVESMLHRADATAEDYAVQWFRLNDKIKEGKLGPDANSALLKLRDAIHEAGDAATGGNHGFTNLMGIYQAEEAAVQRSQAAQAIRDTFMSPEGVIKTPRQGFDVPQMQSDALRKTMASKGEGIGGDLLEPAERARLSNLVDELGRHELRAPANSPGPTGLSDSNPFNIITSGRDNWINYSPGAKGLLNWLTKGAHKSTSDAVDKALMNPNEWTRIMEAYRNSRTPIGPKEYADAVKKQLLMLPSRIISAEIGED